MSKTTSNLNENLDLRKTHIRLLDSVKDICDRHGLIYWIDFGTLLGAYLYQDFIPWDDDIDISMPIRDYRKFLKIAQNELPHDIFLQTKKTDPAYKQNFAKLRDCYSTFLEHHESGNEPYHHGIYIDIFPSVDYPTMPNYLRKALTYVTLKSRENVFVLSRNVFINLPLYTVCKVIWFLLSPFNTDLVAQTPEDNGYLYYMPKKYLYPLIQGTFAGKSYPSPAKPKEYLTVLYKNFSEEPPPEKKVSHAKLIATDIPCSHPRAIKND